MLFSHEVHTGFFRQAHVTIIISDSPKKIIGKVCPKLFRKYRAGADPGFAKGGGTSSHRNHICILIIFILELLSLIMVIKSIKQ